jgi:curved DNA-binding protein CbpA
LLIYMLDQGLSGTMVFHPAPDLTHALYFEDGVPAKACMGAMVAPLDRVLVDLGLVDEATLRTTLAEISRTRMLHGQLLVQKALLTHAALLDVLRAQLLRKVMYLFEQPPQTPYAFFRDENLLASYGGPELTPPNPLVVIMAGIRLPATKPLVDATLGRIGDHRLALHPEAYFKAFELDREEQAVVDLIRARKLTLAELVASGAAPEGVVRWTVYALVVTRQLDFGANGRPPIGRSGLSTSGSRTQPVSDVGRWTQPISDIARGTPPGSDPGRRTLPLSDVGRRTQPSAGAAMSMFTDTGPDASAPRRPPPLPKPAAAAAPPQSAPQVPPQVPPQVRPHGPPQVAAQVSPPVPPHGPPQPPPHGPPQVGAHVSPPVPPHGPPRVPPSAPRAAPPPVPSAPAAASAPPMRRTVPLRSEVRDALEAADSRPSSPDMGSLHEGAASVRHGEVQAQSASELAARRDEIQRRMATLDSEDYFAMMAVDRTATPDQIRATYFALAKSWHPDRLPNELSDLKPQVARVFARLSEAYQTLVDPAKNREYAKLLEQAGKQVGKDAGSQAEEAQVARVVDAVMAYQKAEILLKKNDLGGAEQLALKAVEADPDQPENQVLLAWIRAERRASVREGDEGPTSTKYADLIKVLDKVLTDHPEFERALYYRGVLLKRSGQPDRAFRDFRLAASINPKNIDAVREVRLHEMRLRTTPAVAPSGPSLLGKFWKR